MRINSHLLCLLLLLLARIVVVIVVILVVVFLLLSLLCVILLLLLGQLDLAQCLPLLCKCVSLGHVVADDDVVEDRAAFHLPQVEADETKIGVLVDAVVVLVLRICNLLSLPDALVRRVGDPLDLPLALVSRIVLHRGLPFTVLLVVPIPM